MLRNEGVRPHPAIVAGSSKVSARLPSRRIRRLVELKHERIQRGHAEAVSRSVQLLCPIRARRTAQAPNVPSLRSLLLSASGDGLGKRWFFTVNSRGFNEEGFATMAKLRLGIQVSEDRRSVAIEFAATGQTSSAVVLDLDQLSNLIRVLGQTRHRMVEGLPMPPLEGQSVATVNKPSWYIQVAQLDGSLLAFDHPAFGAVGFAIPRREVASMVRILNNHLSMPPERSTRRN
jgi:hypothetical protein